MKIVKFFIIVLVFLSCKNKDFVNVDNPVEEDKIAGTRVVFNDIGGYTIQDDSLDVKNLPSAYLGSSFDPIFGRTDASFYMNFEIDGGISNYTFGTNPRIDSTVLYLKYNLLKPVYLDTAQLLRLSVYELTEKLTSTMKFNSKTKLSVDNTKDLANSLTSNLITHLNARTKYVIVKGDTVNNLLRIKLDTIIWNRIKSALTNAEALQNSFKGVYITTENGIYTIGKGAIATLNLTDPKSGLYCYYKEALSATKDTNKVLRLTSKTTSSLSLNRYSPVYMPDNMGVPGRSNDLINSFESNATNKRVFIHGFGAYVAKLNVSGYCTDNNPSFVANPTSKAAAYFDSIRSRGEQVAINRALITLKADINYPETPYLRPQSLFITAYDSTGKIVVLRESSSDFDGTGYINGLYNSIEQKYVFNVTITMQKLISRKLKLKAFRIIASAGNVTPYRVVLDLDANSPKKPELEIYYTRLL